MAIGGGRFKRLGIPATTTTAIDKQTIRLSGKKKPHLLFIPTASSDDPNTKYVAAMQQHFVQNLSCTMDTLYLIKKHPTTREIKRKINNADIIYVGGGNTLKMMRKWRLLGVDKLLRDAYKKGTVMTGASAGAICWFREGHSDSMSFYKNPHWNYIAVKGLNLIPATLCPHYDNHTRGKPRAYHFKKMMHNKKIGIGLDDNCAIEIVNGTYRIITSKKKAKAYILYRRDGKIVQHEIPKRTEYTSLDSLLRSKPSRRD